MPTTCKFPALKFSRRPTSAERRVPITSGPRSFANSRVGPSQVVALVQPEGEFL